MLSHFYSKTNQLHQFLKFIYFGIKLYMFRTVFLSIIRSSRLTYSNRHMSNRYFYLLASKRVSVSSGASSGAKLVLL
jgi:hypothetical protein